MAVCLALPDSAAGVWAGFRGRKNTAAFPLRAVRRFAASVGPRVRAADILGGDRLAAAPILCAQKARPSLNSDVLVGASRGPRAFFEGRGTIMSDTEHPKKMAPKSDTPPGQETDGK